MLSKNAHLAELRLFPFVSTNRLQTPTKLVLNRAFQVDTNTDRHLPPPVAAMLASRRAPACGRQGQWPGTLRGGEKVRKW